MRAVKTQAEGKAGQRQAGVDSEETSASSLSNGPTVEDWWLGILETFGKGDGPSGDEDDEEEHDEPYSEAYTSATTKGIVRTTYTQPEPPSSSALEGSLPPAPSESVLAIGLGAQVLPGKAELVSRESPKEMAEDIAGELRETEENVIQKVKDLEEGNYVQKATETRQQIGDAGGRVVNKVREEERRRGWQSKAFDVRLS